MIDDKSKPFFSTEDELLLGILSKLACLFLQNSMAFDNQVKFINNLRQMLEFGVTINSIKGLENILV